MNFQDWTWKAVEGRIIDMAETLRRCPAIFGPRQFGSPMPEVVRQHDEAYGYNAASYRRRPEGAALDRMEEVWSWINGMLDTADRLLVYGWSAVKVRKGLSIGRFAEENGTYERMLRREIKRCCQVIANNLNRNCQPRLNNDDCSVSENQSDIASTTVSSESCAPEPRHWIAPDAKPQIDPALASKRTIDHRAIRARHSDRNRGLRSGRGGQ